MSKPTSLPEFNTNETRTTTLTSAIKSDGWPYDSTEAQFERFSGELRNWLDNNVYQWIKAVNDLGLLDYDSTTDYVVGSHVVGSDGNTYKCKIINGASSTPVDPVGDSTGTWFGLFDQTLIIEDQKTQNTDGGDLTTGSWVQRTLNTVVSNTISGASLSSSKITLPIGTYSITASAPAYKVGNHQAVLYNDTDSAIELTGTNAAAQNTYNGQNRTHIGGVFTITAAKDFLINHQCEITQTTTGSGKACDFTTEVYTTVKIKKIG